MKRLSKKSKNKIPKSFQGVLWSVRIQDLDLQKDKVYIIHQILSYGNLRELKWLLKNYSLPEIKKVFVKHPIRVYWPQSFNFIKEIFLGIKEKLNEKKYITSLPFVR